MSQLLDTLERQRGLPVLVGVALVILNLVVRCIGFALVPPGSDVGFLALLFTDGNLLLHLGVVVGLLGVLLGEVL